MIRITKRDSNHTVSHIDFHMNKTYIGTYYKSDNKYYIPYVKRYTNMDNFSSHLMFLHVCLFAKIKNNQNK